MSHATTYQPSRAATPRILIVTRVGGAFQGYLSLLTAPPSVLGSGYMAVVAAPSDALRDLADETFDLAIIDLGAAEGAALLGDLRVAAPALPVLLLAENGTTFEQRALALAGGALVVERPVVARQLRAVVAWLLQHVRAAAPPA